jgi:hypothetical protein
MKTVQTVVIVFAIAIAYILFGFGIRQVKVSKTHRYNLFISTLFLVLGLLSLGRLSYAQQQNISPSGEQENIQQLQLSQRIKTLSDTQEWKDFKASWKKLDQIKSRGTHYGNAMPEEQYDSFKKELRRKIWDLKKIQGENISSLEINLLERICIDRIDYLMWGTMPLTRAVEPPIVHTKRAIIGALEVKIDKLLELKKKRIINNKEFRQALLNIQADIKTFCTVDTLYQNYQGSFGFREFPITPQSGQSIEDWYISQLERDYAKWVSMKKNKISEQEKPGRLDQDYIQTKQALEKLKVALPGLNELVADLENG